MHSDAPSLMISSPQGLCALASMERSELKERVITNLAFKEFLELVPEVGGSEARLGWAGRLLLG
jgi:hypothetical protein